MIDEETYKRELIRMWDILRGDEYKGKGSCDGVYCGDCPLQEIKYGCKNLFNVVEIYNAVERWSKEHPEKHKVSQLEYDILKSFIDDTKFVYYFYDSDLLMSLLKKGYFQGANNDTDIYEYIENCVIKGEK